MQGAQDQHQYHDQRCLVPLGQGRHSVSLHVPVQASSIACCAREISRRPCGFRQSGVAQRAVRSLAAPAARAAVPPYCSGTASTIRRSSDVVLRRPVSADRVCLRSARSQGPVHDALAAESNEEAEIPLPEGAGDVPGTSADWTATVARRSCESTSRCRVADLLPLRSSVLRWKRLDQVRRASGESRGHPCKRERHRIANLLVRFAGSNTTLLSSKRRTFRSKTSYLY
jgi:hypothetical protein